MCRAQHRKGTSMKKSILKRISLALVLVFAAASFVGCGNGGVSSSTGNGSDNTADSIGLTGGNEADTDFGMDSGADSDTDSDVDSEADGEAESGADAEELTVNFGDRGDSFILHLYDNDTAHAIARHVGTADWRLPIYHYDDYENWEVMQYYDIPSRYEIPFAPETIAKEAAGTVYYSDPNRIILFYGDAEVSGEYTPVGYFDNTDEFRSAVEDNPVLEGWGNKIVLISAGK